MSTTSIAINLTEVQAWLDAADKARMKAAHTAVRAEGFRLMKLMKAQIKAGSPGGAAFKALSVIAGRGRTSVGIFKSTGFAGIKGIGAPSGKTPLKRLAIPVRYWDKTTKDTIMASVGFTGGSVINSAGEAYKPNQISNSWIRIARINQDGGTLPISELGKRSLRYIGAALKKKGRPEEAKFYFWKKSTNSFKIPSRPIVSPFASSQQNQVEENIAANFEAKLRGERI